MPCTNTDGVVAALRDYADDTRRTVDDYTLTSSSGRTAKFTMYASGQKYAIIFRVNGT